jgi:hypothetical protein
METQVAVIAPDIYRLSTYLLGPRTLGLMHGPTYAGTACRRSTTWRTPMTSD